MFVLFRIASLFFFFVSDLLWIKPIKSGLPNYVLIFIRSILTTAIFSLIWITAAHFFNDEFVNQQFLKRSYPVDLGFYAKAVTICLFSFWGLYFFTSSLKLNKFVFVAPLANLGFIFTILTSFWVYQTPISVTQIAALVLFGVTVLVVLKQIPFNEFKLLVIPIVLTHFFWDTAVVFYPLVINNIGVLPFCLLMEICVLISSGILVLINLKDISWYTVKKHLATAVIMAIILCIAVVLFSLSLVSLSVIVVVTLGLLTKLIRLIYGYLVLKELLNSKELIILFLMIAGGVLASI